MNIKKTDLEGVYEILPNVFSDSRGWFMETFREDKLDGVGLEINFIQENQSFSAVRGTLRGIHFQNFPYAQTKLIRCLRGEILDVAVDLRPWSKNYKKWIAVKLSAENKKQLLIPRGFGHGFLTLTDDAEVFYKVDEYYNKDADRSIRFDDSDLGIEWGDIKPVLSDKDRTAPLLSDCNCNFGVRVLVTGAAGQLGYDICKLLKAKGIEYVGADKNSFDLTDEKAIKDYVAKYKPSVVIHCAAYTAVDRAEDEIEACFAVNEKGTKYIAEAAACAGAKFVYISTDYVYGSDGIKSNIEIDETSPLNIYGKSKLAGEKAVIAATDKYFIIRTSWVFGRNGNNFVKTMLRLAKEKQQVSVVDDQVGSPTYTVDLAQLVIKMIFTEKFGIYNASNEAFCSWKEFAEAIFKAAGVKCTVCAVPSCDFSSKAKRPLNSRLDKALLVKNGFEKLPVWQDALERFIKEIL